MKERRTSLRRGSSHVFTERGEKSTGLTTGEQQNIKQVMENSGIRSGERPCELCHMDRYVIIYISFLNWMNQTKLNIF